MASELAHRVVANRRVLVTTDVPFWKQMNGSHLRIASLVHGLAAEGLKVAIWFIGPVSSRERRRLARNAPHLQWFFCETWLDRLARKFRRPAKTSVNDSAPSTSREPTNSVVVDDPIPHFIDPQIKPRFRKIVESWNPEFIVVEYLSLASLIDCFSREETSQRKLRWILDAHDVLSARHAQAIERGERSWLPISPTTELKWAQRFDVVWAIRGSDGEFFQQSKTRVAVVGHPAQGEPLEPRDTQANPCVFGFVGGDSEANRRGLDWLLSQVWSEVKQSAPTAELWIGGSIGEATERMRQEGIRSDEQLNGVHWFGRFDQPEDYYSRIDIALNPVDLDSGLKIKSIEAVGMGRPLVTRTAGAQGLDFLPPRVVLVAEDPKPFAFSMIGLARSASFREESQRAAAIAARQTLTPTKVYGPAVESLARLANEADTSEYK